MNDEVGVFDFFADKTRSIKAKKLRVAVVLAIRKKLSAAAVEQLLFFLIFRAESLAFDDDERTVIVVEN